MNTERSGRRWSGATDGSPSAPASAVRSGGSTPSSTAARIESSSVSASGRVRSAIAGILASSSTDVGRGGPVPTAARDRPAPSTLFDRTMEWAEGVLYAVVGLVLVGSAAVAIGAIAYDLVT